MSTTARELAVIITGSNLAGPALMQLRAGLMGLQGATLGTGTASVAAAGQMAVLYGAQGQVLSRIGPSTVAMASMSAATAKAAKSTGALRTGMLGALSTISPVTLGIAGIGVGTVLAAKSMVDAGTGWEDAFTGVRKTVNATDAEMAGFARGIRNMAMEIPASREEIARVAEAAGQLGIKNANLLSFTRTMVDLGVATNMSSDQAATALARLANITGMPQTEFDRLGSTVVDLGNKYETTETEITEMGLRIAGAGSQIGMSEAQILGWATALSSVGVEAQMGGTAMSKTFIDMARAVSEGGKELSIFADVAGMDVGRFSTLFRTDATQAVLAFVQGLGRIKAEGGTTFEVLSDLGITETRQVDALNRLSGGHGKLAGIMATANTAWAANTALVTEAERRYETTSSKITVMQSKFSELQVAGFEVMQPGLNAMVEGFGTLAQFMGMGAKELGNLSASSEGANAALSGMLPFVGNLVRAFGGLNQALADYHRLRAMLGGQSPDAQDAHLNEMYFGTAPPAIPGSIGMGDVRVNDAIYDTAEEKRRAADDAELNQAQADVVTDNIMARKKMLAAMPTSADLKAAAGADEARDMNIDAQWAANQDRIKAKEDGYKAIEDAAKKAAREEEGLAKGGLTTALKEQRNALDELKRAFVDLATAPVAGTTAFSVEEAKLADQIAQSKFAIDAMKRGELPRSGIGKESKHLSDLERQQETLRLARDVTVGSAERWQRILGSQAPAEIGTSDLLSRLEVARGDMGLPAVPNINAPVTVHIDANGNASVSADTATGNWLGNALADYMGDLLAGGGALTQRHQGGANPQLPGSG